MVIQKRTFSLFVLALVLAPLPVLAFGVDCAHSKERIEHLVCSSPSVLALDHELATLASQVSEETKGTNGDTGEPVDSFGKEQLGWEQHVRNGCKTPRCLGKAYRRRIGQIKRSWAAAL